MRNFLAAFLLLCFFSASGQTVLINGEKTTRPIRWDDFTGTPDQSTNLFAYTYWNIRYNWDAFTYKGDTAQLKVNVIVELGKNSWKKTDKVTDSLLDHERGHFYIGWLCAIAFQKRVNAAVLLRQNYESVIAGIFNEELEKYRQMELLYDNETNHFYNRVQQRKWDLYFEKELQPYR